jgi:hypothetical protein
MRTGNALLRNVLSASHYIDRLAHLTHLHYVIYRLPHTLRLASFVATLPFPRMA